MRLFINFWRHICLNYHIIYVQGNWSIMNKSIFLIKNSFYIVYIGVSVWATNFISSPVFAASYIQHERYGVANSFTAAAKRSHPVSHRPVVCAPDVRQKARGRVATTNCRQRGPASSPAAACVRRCANAGGGVIGGGGGGGGGWSH